MKLYKNFKIFAAIGLAFFLTPEVAFSSDGFHQVTAEQAQSVLCKLEDGSGSVGKLTFMFNAGYGEGLIEFNGLFSGDGKQFTAIVHKIQITKKISFADGSYTFEGIDESISGGAVRGSFKSVDDFEVNGYFVKQFSA
ncbi:MAG TPA: hypothetical protein DIS66_00490, partial [Candidatus Omnitrophica bacterium]|nr:hypothetical protein [Candidatus Omnitrophota bacterium]